MDDDIICSSHYALIILAFLQDAMMFILKRLCIWKRDRYIDIFSVPQNAAVTWKTS